MKAATFETGHGFALGHNPGAPSPFVTWQFTEGENGHRDYYWQRQGTIVFTEKLPEDATENDVPVSEIGRAHV